jgi:uncharacterized protein (DUF1684 family)
MLSFHPDKTTVRVNPGVPVTLNEKPVETAELKSDSSDDRLVLGDLTLCVHASGDCLALRVKGKNSPLRKNFTGLNWFPVDEAYAATGTYIAYESPKKLDSQIVLGDSIQLTIAWYVRFP